MHTDCPKGTHRRRLLSTRLLGGHPVIRSQLLVLMFLSGCAHKTVLLPDTGPTSLAVYNQAETSHTQGIHPIGNQPWAAADIAPYRSAVSGYARTVETELDQHFPHIPNRVIQGYVFAHLSDSGYPVPGYTTAFPLYETHHFALPGEVPQLAYRDRRPPSNKHVRLQARQPTHSQSVPHHNPRQPRGLTNPRTTPHPTERPTSQTTVHSKGTP